MSEATNEMIFTLAERNTLVFDVVGGAGFHGAAQDVVIKTNGYWRVKGNADATVSTTSDYGQV